MCMDLSILVYLKQGYKKKLEDWKIALQKNDFQKIICEFSK